MQEPQQMPSEIDAKLPPGFVLDPAPTEQAPLPANGLSDEEVGLVTKPERRQSEKEPGEMPIDGGSGPIVRGPLTPIFPFDREVDRGPGFVRFGGALLQWNSLVVDAGHTRVTFPVPFDSEVTSIIAGGAIPGTTSFPFLTYDADLAGFWVYCEASRVISYLATGL
jgi:hypothetical protein